MKWWRQYINIDFDGKFGSQENVSEKIMKQSTNIQEKLLEVGKKDIRWNEARQNSREPRGLIYKVMSWTVIQHYSINYYNY